MGKGILDKSRVVGLTKQILRTIEYKEETSQETTEGKRGSSSIKESFLGTEKGK